MPDIPIIMLSSHGERSRVIEAARIGVNEYLRKPISAQSLYDRLVSILVKPRPIVQFGSYYGPKPRTLFTEALAAPTIAPAPEDTPTH
jgi:two-component system, chemotaxis family, chemotaxis protein CheY